MHADLSATGRTVRSRRRRRVLIASAAVIVCLGADLARAPDRQWSAAFAVVAIHAYQNHLSGVMPAIGIRCRFTPSCSHYAEASITRHGALVGGWKALRRIVRCGPWTPDGTVDPPD